jgi:hypothetical protein
MLLDAKPVLYQAYDGDVFHLGETVTVIKANNVPGYLTPASHVLVDFDGKNQIISPAFSIQSLSRGHIILASSPRPTSSQNWLSQKPSLTFVLRNWEADEFWAALSAERSTQYGNTIPLTPVTASSVHLARSRWMRFVKQLSTSVLIHAYAKMQPTVRGSTSSSGTSKARSQGSAT